MAIKISVIIPVYNIERYIGRCLQSVISQTLSDTEIIVINDGSTDNSLSIIEKYAIKDKRIKIVTKKNEGLAFARKTGIENAEGDYILHLDGDDYLENNALELLWDEAVNTQADMIVMPFLWEYEKEGYSKPSILSPETRYNNIDFFRSIAFGDNHWSVWSYLHKRSLYSHPISFCKELSYGEDTYLTTQLVYYAQNITILRSLPLLHYCIQDRSISNGKISSKKVDNILLYPKLIDNFLIYKKEYEALKPAIACIYICAYNLLLKKCWFKGAHERSKETLRLLQKYPQLIRNKQIRPYRKLFRLYAYAPALGRIFAQYYILKKKIG